MADHIQTGNAAKGVNDVVRDPLAEIVLFRISALIVERKNCYGLRVQWTCFGYAALLLELAGMCENRNIASWLELDGHGVVPAVAFVVFPEPPAQALRFHADNRIRARIKL
jgi:hypothetical protein